MVEDLMAVLPFGGTYDLVQLHGSTLLKAFEHAVRRYGGATGEFLQVSGKPSWTYHNNHRTSVAQVIKGAVSKYY